jgi:hypothetical protein
MKKINTPLIFKGRLLPITVFFGLTFTAIFIFIFADIVRARIINIDRVKEQFESQRQKQINNPNFKPKVVVLRGFDYDKGIDSRCLSWSTEHINSGWTGSNNDRDFFIDFYVPPDKQAIICTSPMLATALKAETKKPFLYEVSPTEYGFRVRIVVGVSEVRKPCEILIGNSNCANFILRRQAIVKYEP